MGAFGTLLRRAAWHEFGPRLANATPRPLRLTMRSAMSLFAIAGVSIWIAIPAVARTTSNASTARRALSEGQAERTIGRHAYSGAFGGVWLDPTAGMAHIQVTNPAAGAKIRSLLASEGNSFGDGVGH